MAANTPSLSELPAKFTTKPKKASFSLNSRYMIINLLYNVFGEPAPRLKKGELPKVDKAALEKMSNPFAGRLLRWRSARKQIQSLQNAVTFINPESSYAPGIASPTGSKATMRYATTGYDNVERVFTQAGLSIPLNLDKRGRRAFLTPAHTMTLEQVVAADPRNEAIFTGLLQSPAIIHDADEPMDEEGDDE